MCDRSCHQVDTLTPSPRRSPTEAPFSEWEKEKEWVPLWLSALILLPLYAIGAWTLLKLCLQLMALGLTGSHQ